MTWVIEKWEYGKSDDLPTLELLLEKYREAKDFVVAVNGDWWILVGRSDCERSVREAEAIVGALNKLETANSWLCQSEADLSTIQQGGGPTTAQAYEKRWRSVLHATPPCEGWIGECLVIIKSAKGAGYARGSYRWYRGQWERNGPVPKLDDDAILTHWLDDPSVPPPLPEGWPDCPLQAVDEWLRPYREQLARENAA